MQRTFSYHNSFKQEIKSCSQSKKKKKKRKLPYGYKLKLNVYKSHMVKEVIKMEIRKYF